MAHGYLREYDESWDRDEDRGRGRREDHNSNPRGSDGNDRRRNFMVEDRERLGDDDRQWSGSHQDRWSSRDWRGSGTDEWRAQSSAPGSRYRERTPRNFYSRQDDHYLSWRDRQMDTLDRDYADYCREREQQFHQDFDSWRNRRSDSAGHLRTGVAESGERDDQGETLELTNEDSEMPKADALVASPSTAKGR